MVDVQDTCEGRLGSGRRSYESVHSDVDEDMHVWRQLVDGKPSNGGISFTKQAKEFPLNASTSGPWNAGVVMHYLAVGIVFGAINAILQGLLFGYLNMESNFARIACSICNLPTTFAFLFGLISDTQPIRGYRRKPYMILGWALNFIALLALALLPMPKPYYCTLVDGSYEMGKPPCNPNAPDNVFHFVILFFILVLGTSIADAAASGLLVEYAKMEPQETRGTTQATMNMVQMVGMLSANILAAFGFNGKEYTGSFDQRHQLNFQQYCFILCILAGVSLVLSCLYVCEPSGKRESMRGYLKSGLNMMSTKAFFFISVYIFFSASVFAISTPAATWVGLQWADVKMLQRQLASILGILVSILGTWLAKKYLLNTSWRKIVAITIITTTMIDSVPQFLTIFDVIRNQYFYLGEPIAEVIPQAAVMLVNILLVNEVADESNAGLVAGLVSTIGRLGAPLAIVLSNQIFGVFKPDLSDRENFIADAPAFRQTVGLSYIISYAFSLASLILLPLLPNQKQEAQQRKREWHSSRAYAYSTMLLLSFAFVYSLLVDFISMVPSLRCMRFVGGQGC
jgi:hypothetical protein